MLLIWHSALFVTLYCWYMLTNQIRGLLDCCPCDNSTADSSIANRTIYTASLDVTWHCESQARWLTYAHAWPLDNMNLPKTRLMPSVLLEPLNEECIHMVYIAIYVHMCWSCLGILITLRNVASFQLLKFCYLWQQCVGEWDTSVGGFESLPS